NTQQNRIGLNDRMSPGDISNLSRSGALAFRAEFEGEIPAHRERYWRAAVFDRFDGRTWHAMADLDLASLDVSQVESGARRFQYRVYLEPTGQRWLMSMPFARLSGIDARATQALTHHSREKLESTVSYQAI